MIKSTDWRSALYPQRKWELDKAKSEITDANLIIVKGKPGTGKSFFIQKLIESLPNHTKHRLVNWHCQDGDVNDIHQVGMKLSGELQELNANSKMIERKKSSYLNLGLALAGIPLGAISGGLGFALTGVGVFLEAKGLWANRAQEKRYSKGGSFPISSLKDEINYARNKRRLEKVTIVLHSGQNLDSAEQEALSNLLESLKKKQIQYQVYIESSVSHKFEMLTGSETIKEKILTLKPIEEIGSYLRLVFPSISDEQIMLLQDSSAGNAKIIRNAIETIYDNTAFFDSTVNTSKIKQEEFEIEVKHHVLNGDLYLTNSAFIDRNFRQLKSAQKEMLVALSHIATEYSTDVLLSSGWKFNRRFSEILNNDHWFDSYSSLMRFKSQSIVDYLLSQEVSAELVTDLKNSMILAVKEIYSREERIGSELLFRLVKQILILDCAESSLVISLFTQLLDTKNGYYASQLTDSIYKNISTHLKFEEQSLDQQFAYIFINTVDTVSDDVFMNLIHVIGCEESLTYKLSKIWESYVIGDVDKAIDHVIPLIQNVRSGYIQYWLHSNLFDFLMIKLNKLKPELNRARIINTTQSLASIDKIKESLTTIYEKLNSLNDSLNILSVRIPDMNRPFLWLSVLVQREIDRLTEKKSVLVEIEEKLKPLNLKENLICQIIDVENFAKENQYLISNTTVNKDKGKRVKFELRDRLGNMSSQVVEVYKNYGLDRTLWNHMTTYFYWFTKFNSMWFKSDEKAELQNVLLELYSYRDVNKLSKSVCNYYSLIKLSVVEVAFYSEHGKGVLVDRAINCLQTALSQSVFKCNFSELVEHHKITKLIFEIDDALYLGEYPKLKANFMKYFVDEVVKHFGKDVFFYNEMMKLSSRLGEYFSYLGDFNQAEKYYLKEFQYLIVVKESNPKNILLTEMIVLLNLMSTSLNLRQTETRLATNYKRLTLIDERLAQYTECTGIHEYENSDKLLPDKIGHVINIIEKLSSVCLLLKDTRKVLYYSDVSDIIMSRFRKGVFSKEIVKNRLSALILNAEYESAFVFINKNLERYGPVFVYRNIEVIIKLLSSCDFKKVNSSTVVQDLLKEVLEKASGVRSYDLALVKPLNQLTEAVLSHVELFPFHPHLLQPWNKRQQNIVLPLSNLRKKLEMSGLEAAWLLELLSLMGQASPINAEIYRQIGAALLSDSRFPAEAKLPKYESFDKRVWADPRLINVLLNSTKRNWGRFTQVPTSQRKSVMIEIYSALVQLYSMEAVQENQGLIDNILKWESLDLYMSFKRIFRHSNNRSNQFSHHEMVSMFSDLKELRFKLRSDFKGKFGSYSNRNGKPIAASRRTTYKKTA